MVEPGRWPPNLTGALAARHVAMSTMPLRLWAMHTLWIRTGAPIHSNLAESKRTPLSPRYCCSTSPPFHMPMVSPSGLVLL